MPCLALQDYEELYAAFGGEKCLAWECLAAGTAGRASAPLLHPLACCLPPAHRRHLPPRRCTPCSAPHRASRRPPLAGPQVHKGLSAEGIAALPAVQLSEAALAALHSHTCAVCLEAFRAGDTARWGLSLLSCVHEQLACAWQGKCLEVFQAGSTGSCCCSLLSMKSLQMIQRMRCLPAATGPHAGSRPLGWLSTYCCCQPKQSGPS